MTEAKSGQTENERRLKDLGRVVKLIINSLDACIAKLSKHEKLNEALVQLRPVLLERRNNFIENIRSIDDVDLQLKLIIDVQALISAPFAIGVLAGERYKTKYMEVKIKEMLRSNTSNARQEALKYKSPLKEKKKDITIELAEAYLEHNVDNRLTRNLLMTQIRSDIEKKCKSEGIKPPSQTSIWNYLDEARLP